MPGWARRAPTRRCRRGRSASPARRPQSSCRDPRGAAQPLRAGPRPPCQPQARRHRTRRPHRRRLWPASRRAPASGRLDPRRERWPCRGFAPGPGHGRGPPPACRTPTSARSPCGLTRPRGRPRTGRSRPGVRGLATPPRRPAASPAPPRCGDRWLLASLARPRQSPPTLRGRRQPAAPATIRRKRLRRLVLRRRPDGLPASCPTLAWRRHPAPRSRPPLPPGPPSRRRGRTAGR